MNTNLVLKEIGNRIRAERKARRLTRKEVATRAGMFEKNIQRIEEGKGVYFTTLLLICEGIGVHLSYILSTTWTPPKKPPTLPPYQVKVLEAMVEGGTLEEVAERVGSTHNAVSTVMYRVYKNLGVTNRHLPYAVRRQEAIRIAREHGLIKGVDDGQTIG